MHCSPPAVGSGRRSRGGVLEVLAMEVIANLRSERRKTDEMRRITLD
jgi:hypothetical protein